MAKNKIQEGKKQKPFLRNLNNEEKIMAGVIIVLLISAIVLAFPYLKNIKLSSNGKAYSVDVTRIEGCDECFSLDLISSTFLANQNRNVKVSKEKSLNYSSPEAKKLIDKYNIKKIPALIISSRDIGKINLDETIFRKEKSAAIFDKAVPYLDLSSGKITGIINMKEVYDSNCKECASLSKLKTQLERSGIKIGRYDMVPYSSDEGKELISENSITFLPALLISKDIEEYWWAFSGIKSSLAEKEDYYRFSEPLFPYQDIATQQVKGKVKITYVTNNSCEDCLNITKIKTSFQQLGIYIDSEKYADVNSIDGKNMLIKYNITAIPTVVLSKEIIDYTNIKSTLEAVGTFEKDNAFVFRKLDVLNAKYQRTGI